MSYWWQGPPCSVMRDILISAMKPYISHEKCDYHTGLVYLATQTLHQQLNLPCRGCFLLYRNQLNMPMSSHICCRSTTSKYVPGKKHKMTGKSWYFVNCDWHKPAGAIKFGGYKDYNTLFEVRWWFYLFFHFMADSKTTNGLWKKNPTTDRSPPHQALVFIAYFY